MEGTFLDDIRPILEKVDSGRWPDCGPERNLIPMVETAPTTPPPVTDRLKKGAEYLAKLWRENQRCPLGWSTSCSCVTPTPFCKAKLKWLKLAEEDKRVLIPSNDPYGLIGMMKVAEVEATGLTLTVQFPAFGKMGFGPKGEFDTQALLDAYLEPDGVVTLLKLIQQIKQTSK